ncbi:MAG: phenylacetate-CoA oxygenase subunit PaaC [Saprospiraceae bacterium]|nr:phenylacetate-CoA oxygenase subunit PaaC [Saprospiraceae bacterium]
MGSKEQLFKYLLRLGDNALIQGHRLSEWCSRGPILEEDIALSNLALDNIGRAQAFLQYASEVEGNGHTADDLAYRRSERQYLNFLITELPTGNFAYTITKQLFIAQYDVILFEALCKSTDTTIAGIAAKAIKEARYHASHASDWCLRLGMGTALSHDLLQNEINDIWMFTGEMFEMTELDKDLVQFGISPDLTILQNIWLDKVGSVLIKSGIQLPGQGYQQTGSQQGIHTEHLGHILSEMQYLQRAYPDATW